MKKVIAPVLCIHSFLSLFGKPGGEVQLHGLKRAHASRLCWVEITLVCLGKISANGSN